MSHFKLGGLCRILGQHSVQLHRMSALEFVLLGHTLCQRTVVSDEPLVLLLDGKLLLSVHHYLEELHRDQVLES